MLTGEENVRAVGRSGKPHEPYRASTDRMTLTSETQARSRNESVCARALLFLTLVSTRMRAQVNAGTEAPDSTLPSTMTHVAEFNLPWGIAFLPDGRMLIMEKVGPVWLVTQQGMKTPVKKGASGSGRTTTSKY